MKIDWKHIFNWDVVSVKAPEAVVRGGKLVGYRVIVAYKYHGADEELYSMEESRFYKLWAGPKEAAQASYREHLRNMAKKTELNDMKIDWKHIFNWDVISVKAPEAVMRNGRIVGYNVVVDYKYHGKDTEFYSADDDRMYTTYAGPQAAAQEAYNGYLRRIKKQNERQIRTR